MLLAACGNPSEARLSPEQIPSTSASAAASGDPNGRAVTVSERYSESHVVPRPGPPGPQIPTSLSEGKLHIVAFSDDEYPLRVHPFDSLMVVTQGQQHFTFARAIISAPASLSERFDLEDGHCDYQAIEGQWPNALRFEISCYHQRFTAFSEYRYEPGQQILTAWSDEKDTEYRPGAWTSEVNPDFPRATGGKALLLRGDLQTKRKLSNSLCKETTLQAVGSAPNGSTHAVATGCGQAWVERWLPKSSESAPLALPGAAEFINFRVAASNSQLWVTAEDGAKGQLPMYLALVQGDSFTRLQTHDAGPIAALTTAGDGTAFITTSPALVSVTSQAEYRRYPAPRGVKFASAWARDRNAAFVSMDSTLYETSAIFSTLPSPLQKGPLPEALSPFEPMGADCRTPMLLLENAATTPASEELFDGTTKWLQASLPLNATLVDFRHAGTRRLALIVDPADIGRLSEVSWNARRPDPDKQLVCFAPPRSAARRQVVIGSGDP